MDGYLTVDRKPSNLRRLFSVFVPMLLVAVSYVDPGKWVVAVEGGAHFGSGIVVLMLVFNFAAILCQYLSVRVAVVTGKDLAQICSEEYDKVTCMFLGVQAEISIIALDLNLILGAAHGLNLIFGLDLFTCVFLTALDALLFPVFSTFLEEGKAKFLCVCMGSIILISYIFGVLISQPEVPFSTTGTLTDISRETIAALMSLLGASIVPHNFYLHSSLVKVEQLCQKLMTWHFLFAHLSTTGNIYYIYIFYPRSFIKLLELVKGWINQECGGTSVTKEVLCHQHLFAILFIFSGIYLVNCVLVNSAANVFYTTDFLLLTFQDALSLMDQTVKNMVLTSVLILVLVFANHTTALTWNVGKQTVLHNLFGSAIPGWLHHVTIRVIAIVVALCCVLNSGAEGIYQLLIYTQIAIALLLPSSVIPLFRVASSRSIMGAHRISQSVQLLLLVVFVGMLGLETLFVIEMISGNSAWASNLRWNMGSGMSLLSVLLLSIASFSLCLMLLLAAIPVTSASPNLTIQDFPHLGTEKIQYEDRNENQYLVQSIQIKEPIVTSEETPVDMSSSVPDLNLPAAFLDCDTVSNLTTIEENGSDITKSSPSECHSRDSVRKVVLGSSDNSKMFSDGEAVDGTTLTTESSDLAVKTQDVEGVSQTKKDDERDTWVPKESIKVAYDSSSPSVMSDGPGSYRSLGGKGDDVGSGTGSLSRLSGLGRGGRRQLAVLLDEFWGQMFDLHGQATKEAKLRKLDALLGIDSKVDQKLDPDHAHVSPKLDNSRKDFGGHITSAAGRGSDYVIRSSLYDNSRQQMGQGNVESYYGAQRELSSSGSNNSRFLYMHNPNHNAMDSGYSSLRLTPSADVSADQPATIHGYQIAQLSRLAKERGYSYLTGQLESIVPKSPPPVSSNYADPFVISSGQKPRNGVSARAPPGFPSLSVSRNNSLQAERAFYDISSSGTTENVGENVGDTVDAKKYHSLPDISGLTLPYRNSLLSDGGVPLDGSIFQQSSGRTMYEAPIYPNALSNAYSIKSSNGGAALLFDEFSSSKVCRDAFSLQLNSGLHTGSLWSRQPGEQFGVAAEASSGKGQEVGNTEPASAVDFETKLLQYFRVCIKKLLKLEGSDWLFRQNDGADEDLIDRVAARERFFSEAETREMSWIGHMGESQFSATSFPHCGDDCIWRIDLIISFGVWSIHRILELSLMESRPELWGKYTYVLNRLQGIIDLAFSKPRCPMTPCFCLQLPALQEQRSSPPISNGGLPPPAKQGKGKCTTASMFLDMVKDVEIAISCRKGRTGTAAGDVAFPKGKENLASVLKRYKRRLSNKAAATSGGRSGLHQPTSPPYGT